MKYLFYFLLIINLYACQPPATTPEIAKIMRTYSSIDSVNNLYIFTSDQGLIGYQNAIDCAKKLNRPIFIYFIVHAIGYNYFLNDFIHNKTIVNTLNENFISIWLYVDDRKKLDTIDINQLQALGLSETSIKAIKKSKSVGKLYWALQTDKFKLRNCQPTYVILTPEGKILRKPFHNISNASKFIQKLEGGIKKFKRHQKKE